MSVQSGESEFRMPFMALPLLVIESENRKAGAPLPKIPTNRIVEYLSREIVFKPRNAKGNATKPEIPTRKHANSMAVNQSSDFLMRI